MSDPATVTTISVLGAGAMGEAMMAGLLRNGLVGPDQLRCSHPRAERRDELAAQYGVRAYEGSLEAAQGADLVVLAVKPQVLPRIAAELASAIEPQAVVLSIVAGVPTNVLCRVLSHPSVVRAMPNTPAQVGAGVSVWFATRACTASQRGLVRSVLGALGDELEVEEERQVAMATAVSGTGPTYSFMFIEALVDAGVHLGFPRHLARRLVLETVRGSVEFAIQTGMHPAQLRDLVTSPGGTSAEALAAMDRGRFRTVLSDAVWAAYRRTQELESAAGSREGT